MDKDIITLFKELQNKRFEQSIGQATNKLSNLIDEYKDVESYQDDLE